MCVVMRLQCQCGLCLSIDVTSMASSLNIAAHQATQRCDTHRNTSPTHTVTLYHSKQQDWLGEFDDIRRRMHRLDHSQGLQGDIQQLLDLVSLLFCVLFHVLCIVFCFVWYFVCRSSVLSL